MKPKIRMIRRIGFDDYLVEFVFVVSGFELRDDAASRNIEGDTKRAYLIGKAREVLKDVEVIDA